MVTERNQRVVRRSAILVTLLLTALLLAQGVTQLVASSVLPLAPQDAAAAAARPRVIAQPDEPSPRALAEAVLARNIFDSPTGALTWDPPVDQMPVADDGAPEIIEDPTGEPQPCQGSMRLVAALVVPRVPMLSFASIESGGKTFLYRPGMQIDGHEVIGLREHRVFLRPSGRPVCQIQMFAPTQPLGGSPMAMQESPPPSEPNVPIAETKPSGSGISEEDLNQGISQVSDTQYNVSRSLLDRVLANQGELMRAARIIPYEENGRVVGVKVYGIRRSSLLGKLGIQNGDVLRTINGFDLSSPDSALEAYTKLREMDQFSIAMMRRGQPRNMDYSVK